LENNKLFYLDLKKRLWFPEPFFCEIDFANEASNLKFIIKTIKYYLFLLNTKQDYFA